MMGVRMSGGDRNGDNLGSHILYQTSCSTTSDPVFQKIFYAKNSIHVYNRFV